MSIALMSEIWPIQMQPSEKIVLLALADAANDDGITWIAVNSQRGKLDLMSKTSLAERTLQGAIQRLCEAGYLSRRENPGKGVIYTVRSAPAQQVVEPPQDLRGSPPQDLRPAEFAETPAGSAGYPSVTVIKKHARSGACARLGFHRLPNDWRPRDLPDALASKRAEWPPGWEADQADAFRAWAANAADSNGKGRKLDWDQAYQNWLRSADRERARTQPKTAGRSDASGSLFRPRGGDGLAQALEREVARLGGLGRVVAHPG